MKKFSIFLIISVIIGYLVINITFLLSFSQNIIGILDYKNYKYINAYIHFSKAQISQTEDKYRQELKYNIANSLYKQKMFDVAIDKYREIKTDNDELNFKVNHNIGNSYYRLGEGKNNRDEKIGLYRGSLQSYQTAMQIKEDQETKANYEFVKKELEKLLEQKKQEEEQKKKEQEKSQNGQNNKEQNNEKQDKKDEELKPKDNSIGTKNTQNGEKKDEQKTQSGSQNKNNSSEQQPQQQRGWTNSGSFQNSGIDGKKDKLSEEDIKSLEQRIQELKQIEKENLKNLNKSGENGDDFFKNFNFGNIFNNFFEGENFSETGNNGKDW